MSEQSNKTTRKNVEVEGNNSVDLLCLRARQVFDLVAHFGLRIVTSTPANGKPYVFSMTVEGDAAKVRSFSESLLVGFIPRNTCPLNRASVSSFV
jgi:hypothetical protein